MKRCLILLVEDDPVARFVVQKQLAQLGYACETVASGEKALERYSNDLALIFMDVGLPGIDGIMTTKIIRQREQQESLERVPVIALTAHSNRNECLNSGMDEHLQKPATLVTSDNMNCRLATLSTVPQQFPGG